MTTPRLFLTNKERRIFLASTTLLLYHLLAVTPDVLGVISTVVRLQQLLSVITAAIGSARPLSNHNLEHIGQKVVYASRVGRGVLTFVGTKMMI